MNRSLPFIEQLDREAEHKRRCDRVTRSEDVYNAACDEAIQQGVTLTTDNRGTYTIASATRTAVFYAWTNTLFVQHVSEHIGRCIRELPELDVYDVLLLFCEGKLQ